MEMFKIAPGRSVDEPMDATINDWFDVIRRIQLLSESSLEEQSPEQKNDANCTTFTSVIKMATEASISIENLARFLNESKWLYSCHPMYHRETNNRLGNLMHGLCVMYEYCCKCGRQSAQDLCEEADQAFKQLYSSLKVLTDRLLQYIRSADFQEQISAMEKNCWDRGHHILFDVFNGLGNIITVIADFDMRTASSMWCCILLLIANHTAATQKAPDSTVRNWLTPTLTHVYAQLVHSTKPTEVGCVVDGRKISLATYYAKIVLQICTVYTGCPNYGLFSQFAINYLVVRENLIGCEQSMVEPLLSVLDKILSAIYGHGLKGNEQFRTSAVSVLHMYSVIQSLLLRETRSDVLARYANVAFNLNHIAKLLDTVAFSNATPTEDLYRPAVSRLTVLIVLATRKYPQLVQNIDALLFTALHSNHYYRSILALDIWLLRSEFLQPQRLHHYVLHVFCATLGTGIFCQRPSSVFLRRLLRHFFAKLPGEWRLDFNQKLLDFGGIQFTQMVWLVLGIELVHPDEQLALKSEWTTRYRGAEAQYRSDPEPSTYYKYALALHGLREFRQPDTTAILSDLCANLHSHLPQVFHVELQHLQFDNASHLSDVNVRDTLRSLAKFLAATETPGIFWHGLIALQAIKLLGRAIRKGFVQSQMREECVQLSTSIYAKLLQSDDAVVQLNCWREFFEMADDVEAHRDIIGRTISGSKQLKLDLRRWAQRTSAVALCEATPASFLLDAKYGHICRGLFASFSSGAISRELHSLREKIEVFKVLSARGNLTQEHALELVALGEALANFAKSV